MNPEYIILLEIELIRTTILLVGGNQYAWA